MRFLSRLGIFVSLFLTLSFAQQQGGTAVIALIQEPGLLNSFFGSQSAVDLAGALTQEPLFIADATGTYQPLLAEEIPTVENDGISEDYLTVTYKLREGLVWSDGTPFTADDIVFTFEVYKNPESTPAGAAVVAAYEAVESVTKIDERTVEVKMNGVNPGYLELWQAVLPAHMFDSSAVTDQHPQARIPLGTGPFIITEWLEGDSITFERNPNYREEGKPYLDSVVVRIIPEKEVAISSLLTGDVDTVFFITAGDLQSLSEAQENGQGVTVILQDTKSWVEWLWLNNADPNDASQPHPVLGDPAIREAMDLAIDRQSIVDEILGGFGSLTGSFIYSGFAAVDKPATTFDPEAAKAVLENAGWIAGQDGIREKDGVRASLRFTTIAGDQVRELYQQLIQQNLKDVGLEIIIDNQPANLIFAGWGDDGLYVRGQYDIMMSRAGYAIDPASWASEFSTAQIPSDDNQAGSNAVRYANAEFDTLVADAAVIADPEERKALYARAVERFAQDRPALPLYSSAWGWVWRDTLQGVDTNWWNGMWPSVANWYIEQ